MADREPYEPPAIVSSTTYATGAESSRELGDFAERFELEDLGGHLGRARCKMCGATFHVVHSPMSKLGTLELAGHIAEHAP